MIFPSGAKHAPRRRPVTPYISCQLPFRWRTHRDGKASKQVEKVEHARPCEENQLDVRLVLDSTTKGIHQLALTVGVEEMAESAEIVHEKVHDVCQKATKELKSAPARTMSDRHGGSIPSPSLTSHW